MLNSGVATPTVSPSEGWEDSSTALTAGQDPLPAASGEEQETEGERRLNPWSSYRICPGPSGTDVLQMPWWTKRGINHFQPDDFTSFLHPGCCFCVHVHTRVHVGENERHTHSCILVSFLQFLMVRHQEEPSSGSGCRNMSKNRRWYDIETFIF